MMLIVSLSLFQWFQLIVQNRPHYDENVATLNDINDVRNGVLANILIHNSFDPRHIAVLKVCLPACPLSDGFSDPYVATNPDSKPCSSMRRHSCTA